MSERATAHRHRPRRRRTTPRRALLIGGLVTALGAGAITGGMLMTASASGPGAGTYRLVNAADSTCLRASSAGTRLATAACDDSAGAQVWQLTEANGGFTVVGDKDLTICERFKGNSSGDEPTSLGEGADGTSCRYSASDVTYQ